ncbi:MAG: hypothetical protein RL297_1693 [Pseudomonadota bacterium]|jgi:hypothetical protein
MSNQVSKKIERVFEFLKEHHHFNQDIQYGYVKQTLNACSAPRERMRLLLDRAVNSQSRPKLDEVANFWRSVHERHENLDSFGGFLTFVDRKAHSDLATALAKQSGWGPKTSALFVRNLWLAGEESDLASLIWSDLDLAGERLYLPVDTVIQNIFSQIDKRKKWGFHSINNLLQEELKYSPQEMLVWDDLWFWGFITQRSEPESKQRTFEWNEAKYWSIFTAPREKITIRKVKALSTRFLNLTQKV